MSKRDEGAAKAYCDSIWPSRDFANLYNWQSVQAEHTKSFLAGCAHKEKQFERLVKISGQCVAAYKAKAEELWAHLDQLDEILKEVGDGID